jgi:glycosyltransferase involved in cell wall biosynthesis
MKMSDALTAIGNEVFLISNESIANLSASEEQKDIDVYIYYGVKYKFDIQYLKPPLIKKIGPVIYAIQSYLAAKKKHVDIVFSRHLLSAYVCANLGLNVILELHSISDSFQHKYILPVLFKNSRLKKLVVISNALKHLMLQKYPTLPKEKILVEHDAIDLDRFNELPVKEIAKNQLGFNKNQFIIGYTGSLYKGRGMEIIFQIAALFKKDRIIIMGGREDELSKLKVHAKQNGLKNITLYGFVPNGELTNYLLACDVLLMPYQRQLYTAGGRKENNALWMSPMKMFEYMASGVPIISSNITVLREVLEHNINALLVEPNNIEDWKKSIESIKNNIGLSVFLAKNARTKVNHYTWMKRSKRILEAVDSMPDI